MLRLTMRVIGEAVVLSAAGAVLTYAGVARDTAAALRCTLEPGRALALVRVERDTMLAGPPDEAPAMSFSSVRPGADDSLLAAADTPIPAARVRLLRLDPATRAALAAEGVAGREPVAFLRAAPYRADCRVIRWTDTARFAVPGETGFVRARLAPRGEWVHGTPLLIVPDGWNYPYPRRRGLAYDAPANAPLASAVALFDLENALEAPPASAPLAAVAGDALAGRAAREAVWAAAAEAQRARALAWARANPAEGEREPARATVRRAVLAPDWTAVARGPSRLRGSYRVTMTAGDARGVWFFRTHDRPGSAWRGRDSVRTTADLLAAPYTAGYRLVGYAAASADSLGGMAARSLGRTHGGGGGPRVPLVWLVTEDRPTLPGNDARHTLAGVLEFTLGAAPEALWPALEAFVPPTSAGDSAFYARSGRTPPRGERQPRVPITVRLDAQGAARADTTLVVGGRSLRVLLERTDTLAIRRPF